MNTGKEQGKRSSIHDYSDIINLRRPEPRFHHRMPVADRAAQFSPFAALTGYSSVIDEVGRTTSERIFLDDYEKERINRKLNLLEAEISNQPAVTITWFSEDKRKDGGEYITQKATLKRIDPEERMLLLSNGQKVKIDDIIKIEKKI